jgi:hypothetical protein
LQILKKGKEKLQFALWSSEDKGQLEWHGLKKIPMIISVRKIPTGGGT